MVARGPVSPPVAAQQFHFSARLFVVWNVATHDKASAGFYLAWCSAFAAVFQVPFAIANFRTPRHFSPDESKGVPKILFYPLFAIGIATLLLQFYNIAMLNRFWPFFAGIFVHLMAAMLQFVRLVLPRQPVIK